MMKRFLIRTVLLFIVPVFLGLVACEYFLRKVPNDYQYKNEWLTHNCGKIEVLNLGSSHAYFGICPQYFSHSAFNAAHVSQSIKYDHFIFKKFIDDMDSLKVIILPLSYFSMISNGPEGGIEDWRVKYYSIYYGCDYHKHEPKYNLEIIPKIRIGTAIHSVFGKANNRYVDSLGWGYSCQELFEQNEWEIEGKTAAQRHTRQTIDTIIVNENVYRLDEIIQICQNRKISVIILTTPTYKTYRDNLKTEQLDIMLKYGHLFESKYENVHFINLLDSDDFVQEDFQNSDHLNAFGAEKLTALLDHYIDSLQLIK